MLTPHFLPEFTILIIKGCMARMSNRGIFSHSLRRLFLALTQLLILKKCPHVVFLKNNFSYWLIFWLSWVFVAAQTSVAASRSSSPVVACRLLIPAASLGAEHGLWVCGLQWLWSLGSRARAPNCGTQAWLLHGIWDLPRPGIEPASPALAGDSLPLSH